MKHRVEEVSRFVSCVCCVAFVAWVALYETTL